MQNQESNMEIKIEVNGTLTEAELVDLYSSNSWSSAEKPKQLLAAMKNSHTVVSAKVEGKLVGLGNSLSDGNLVVYYPHLLVNPDYQRMGIGSKIMQEMSKIYKGYHQQILVADGKAIDFYKSAGFERAGKSEPMWIYSGTEH